jgi:hypothetical protein
MITITAGHSRLQSLRSQSRSFQLEPSPSGIPKLSYIVSTQRDNAGDAATALSALDAAHLPPVLPRAEGFLWLRARIALCSVASAPFL